MTLFATLLFQEPIDHVKCRTLHCCCNLTLPCAAWGLFRDLLRRGRFVSYKLKRRLMRVSSATWRMDVLYIDLYHNEKSSFEILLRYVFAMVGIGTLEKKMTSLLKPLKRQCCLKIAFCNTDFHSNIQKMRRSCIHFKVVWFGLLLGLTFEFKQSTSTFSFLGITVAHIPNFKRILLVHILWLKGT